MSTITVQVPETLAMRYRSASEVERRRLDILFAAQMQQILDRPPRDLQQIMSDLSAEAAANGLTEETLDQILREKRA